MFVLKNPPSPLKLLCSCSYNYVQMTCESHYVGWEHFLWSQVKNSSFLSLRTYSAAFFNCNSTVLPHSYSRFLWLQYCMWFLYAHRIWGICKYNTQIIHGSLRSSMVAGRRPLPQPSKIRSDWMGFFHVLLGLLSTTLVIFLMLSVFFSGISVPY